ncbi:NAD(P)H-dependent oxidoreductase [Photobacterium sp. OFAV2-7]|uniref:NAD(P)H-dependent oxidoreductase n=1 Tax=Photobacterium sp. OFAV2-7 TaxID=2917748 RepID=UPI001EF45363|nr:NAD(P)H-dependent oxidoreductase [Photobacterium sp. OFAV2-7]MCG7586441.1 NAD(P)H-dependent oxidoreductase [Photobacterium sp. OFAV2-7]
MSKIVVISGHPDLKQSYTNTVILEALESAGSRSETSQVEVRRLDSLYPEFIIDAEAEQQALLDADVIIFQFPYYWYSVPALLKKWIDDVFTFNFAYGPEGNKLKGKDFILSFTVGGPEESYSPLGYNHFTIEQMLYPLQQTAYLAGMNYHEPVYTHRMVYIPGVYNTQEQVEARACHHADRLIIKLDELTSSAENKITKLVQVWFEQFDQLPEGDSFFLNYLAEDIHWQMPEGTFKGHAGFRDWYASARALFKPNCDHQVEQINIQALDDTHYQVDLRIRLVADTYTGESVNMLVNEVWKLAVDGNGKAIIHDYRVTPV